MAPSVEIPEEGCPGEKWPSNAFLYAGIVQLIGWNAVLTASGFLDHKVFPGRQWAFLAAITYSSGVTLGQALMIRGPLPRLPFSVRWMLSVTSMTIAPLGLLLVVVGHDGSPADGVSFGLALACVVLLSFGNAMFSSSTFGLAGAADPALSGRLMMGQGFAGVLTGVASIFTPGVQTFTVLLGATGVVTALALVVYVVTLRRHPLIRPLLQSMAEDRLRPPAGASPGLSQLPANAAFLMASPRRRSRLIVADVLPQAGGVLFVFLVTFTVFPGVVSDWQGDFGLPRTHFVTLMVGEFQLLDVLGRTAGGFVRQPGGKVTLFASAIRVIMVPLFIGAERMEDSLLSSGGMKILLMAIFAFSNGFVSTLGMMLGPQRVLVNEEKETAGHIMSFALVAGILSGSLLALLTQM